MWQNLFTSLRRQETNSISRMVESVFLRNVVNQRAPDGVDLHHYCHVASSELLWLPLLVMSFSKIIILYNSFPQPASFPMETLMNKT